MTEVETKKRAKSRDTKTTKIETQSSTKVKIPKPTKVDIQTATEVEIPKTDQSRDPSRGPQQAGAREELYF